MCGYKCLLRKPLLYLKFHPNRNRAWLHYPQSQPLFFVHSNGKLAFVQMARFYEVCEVKDLKHVAGQSNSVMLLLLKQFLQVTDWHLNDNILAFATLDGVALTRACCSECKDSGLNTVSWVLYHRFECLKCLLLSWTFTIYSVAFEKLTRFVFTLNLDYGIICKVTSLTQFVLKSISKKNWTNAYVDFNLVLTHFYGL